MARIRTIKPEFWSSPSTAKASPWARLLFIAMWNWADDYGRGTANLKELEGFVFPNDDHFCTCSGNTVQACGTSVQFRELITEVAKCFGVLFYTVNDRPYYQIPTWDDHQRNERRAKASKYPPPPPEATENPVNTGETETVAEIPYNNTETPHTPTEAPKSSGTGTGEQGNRGTGEREQGNSAANAAGGTRQAGPAEQQPLNGDLLPDPPPTEQSPAEIARANTQTLISEWIDACTTRPPNKVIGHLSKEIKGLLEEGINFQAVRAGLIAWHKKSLHPSALPSLVHEVQNPPQPKPKMGTTDRRVMAGMELAHRLAAEEQAQEDRREIEQ